MLELFLPVNDVLDRLRVYKSRNGGVDHEVRNYGPGQYSCTCKAAFYGVDCWAVKSARGEDKYLEVTGRLPKIWETVIIDIKELQKEQWSYINAHDAQFRVGQLEFWP